CFVQLRIAKVNTKTPTAFFSTWLQKPECQDLTFGGEEWPLHLRNDFRAREDVSLDGVSVLCSPAQALVSVPVKDAEDFRGNRPHRSGAG
ncbi:MAG: hypothetical protein MZU95_05900, partial [Desulfomicrobium escambiense]|nr:hypothetical protein [Desulfomicrobium escambiense]